MHTDKLILQRFDELQAKAGEVKKTYCDPFGSTGRIIHHVNGASFNEWATSVLNLLQRVFGDGSAHYKNFEHFYREFRGGEYSTTFEDCWGILRAAQEDYSGGYLFNMRALIKAETMMDVLAQAEIFKNADQPDIACILAGIALELAVKERCEREKITTESFANMNMNLRKAGVYNQAMGEQLSSWYTRRNDAAHGNIGKSTPRDADDMIKGVRRFIAEYL